MTDTAVCRQCNEARPVASFQIFNGKYRASLCNPCNWKKYGPKDKAQRMTEEGRRKRSKWNRTKERSAACKERERRHSIKYREHYPEKAKAKRIVRAAIVSGLLVRPDVCSACLVIPGVNRAGAPLIHAHHADYANPLDVQWLCIACHAKEHRADALKETPNGN